MDYLRWKIPEKQIGVVILIYGQESWVTWDELVEQTGSDPGHSAGLLQLTPVQVGRQQQFLSRIEGFAQGLPQRVRASQK